MEAGAPKKASLEELRALLQSLQTLKPPGVNKSKVAAISALCLCDDPAKNSIDRNAAVQAMHEAFQQSPATHKLGILYIVDSVARQWYAGQGTGALAQIAAILPNMMGELIAVAPENQKERIQKLIDIWVSSKTFPEVMLSDFKRKLAGISAPTVTSSAKPAPAPSNGQPSASNYASVHTGNSQAQATMQPPQANNAPSDGGILSLLASLQQHQPPAQHQVAPVAAAPVPMASTYTNVNPYTVPSGQPVSMSSYPQPTPIAQPNVVTQPNPVPQASFPQNGQAQSSSYSQQAAPIAAITQGGVTNPLPSQLQLLQQLATQISPEQLVAVISALPQLAGQAQSAFQPVAAPSVTPMAPFVVAQPTYGTYSGQESHSRSYEDQQYMPRDRERDRERSRSPDYKRRRHSPPNRRDSPTYGVYDPQAAQAEAPHHMDFENRRGRGKGRGGRNDYRQRSPPPSRERHQAPQANIPPGNVPHSNMPKPIGYDNKLPAGSIKVLSRTLFVGGVKTSEAELVAFMRQYGQVQSCIVNPEKRHAFLKLISHQDAIAAKTAIAQMPDSEYRPLFERINWAVGYGPTHCADYNTGQSIIPISTLTEADKKWMLNADFGGTGGKPIESGVIVEEPDIEIGAGPSSKAISRRGGPNQRGGNFHGRRGHDSGARFRKPDRSEPRPVDSHAPEPNTIGPPPPVPTFGVPLPGMPYSYR
ncbi:hypothetical protein EJ06DRAFT_515360 [Trichodelitschia bisporula]|uniref:CID domain-containing protein n=1 Tax=Trichodelitschia bisporula TaxID=703511 RepID=A0A6G1HMM2_9PEZI|nr:hypothetical protein EJ06DRAFT_515360 [Trichodelitschia bisporula]